MDLRQPYPGQRALESWRGVEQVPEIFAKFEQRFMAAVCHDRLQLRLAQTVNPCRLVGTEVELEAGGHWILLDARLYGHQHAQVQQLNVGQVHCVRHIDPPLPANDDGKTKCFDGLVGTWPGARAAYRIQE